MDFRFGDQRLADFELPLADIAQVLTNPQPRSIVSLDIPTDMDAHEAKLGRSAVTILWEVDADLQQMNAMLVRMHGVAFKFHLKPTGTAQDGGSLVRPHILDLIGPRRKGRLYLGWPGRTSGRYVFFRLKPALPVTLRTPKSV